MQLTQYVTADEEAGEDSAEEEEKYPGKHASLAEEMLCLDEGALSPTSFWSRERQGDVPDISATVGAGANGGGASSRAGAASKSKAMSASKAEGGGLGMMPIVAGVIAVLIALLALLMK